MNMRSEFLNQYPRTTALLEGGKQCSDQGETYNAVQILKTPSSRDNAKNDQEFIDMFLPCVLALLSEAFVVYSPQYLLDYS